MTISFTCRRCGRRYAVPEATAGKRARCKQCGEVATVPGGAGCGPRGATPAVDVYGLEDTRVSSPTVAYEPSFPPPRRAPATQKKRGSKKAGGFALLGLRGKALLAIPGIVVLLFLAGASVPPIRTPAAVGVVLVGLVVGCAGGIEANKLLVNETYLTQLLIRIVVPIRVFYFLGRLREAWGAVLSEGLGFGLAMIGGMWLFVLHPPPGMPPLPNLDFTTPRPFRGPDPELARRDAEFRASAPRTDDVVVLNLYDLDSPSPPRRWLALVSLAWWPVVEEHRTKVVAAFRLRLDDPDPTIRTSARDGLERWSPGVDVVPDLIGTLNSPLPGAHQTALHELAKRKDPRAAGPMAALLTSDERRAAASTALREFGAGAEEAVIPFLHDANAAVRAEACDILSSIGTGQSIPLLDEATRDPDPAVARKAAGALAACRTTVGGSK